jgi:hypothetical protein
MDAHFHTRDRVVKRPYRGVGQILINGIIGNWLFAAQGQFPIRGVVSMGHRNTGSKEAGLAPSWAAGIVRDGNDEKIVPTEAVGSMLAGGWEGKMKILV